MSQRDQEASWRICDGIDGITIDKSCASGGADNVAFEVRTDIGQRDGAGLRFALLSGPFLNGAFDLSQIIDAGVPMGCRAGLNVIGYRDGRQQANDSGYDHDFNQRKPRA
jgi:hypothetical protein